MTGQIPTPRSDAASVYVLHEDGEKASPYVPIEFSRQLERENDVMMQTLCAARTALRVAEERRLEPVGVRDVVHNAIAEVCQMRREFEEGLSHE